MDSYKSRLLQYREEILGHGSVRNNFLTCIKFQGVVYEPFLEEALEKVRVKSGDADFSIIKLIRLIYLDECSEEIRLQVVTALCTFPFWPRPDSASHSFKTIVFWSENHALMLLTSAHLLKHKAKELNIPCQLDDYEDRLLLAYLSAHVATESIYETMSSTYLPYTLSALLNLVDFSPDSRIQEMARKVANILAVQVLSFTTAEGVCTLSASARAFPRIFASVRGHNMCQFIRVANGVAPDDSAPSAITDFLLTSSWVPPPEAFESLALSGYKRFRGNHDLSQIRSLYPDLSEEERIPFFWSAGLITHTHFIKETRRFQLKNDLADNVHLKHLWWAPKSVAPLLSKSLTHFSCGQNYTSIVVNLYKKKNMCLSSFENYNAGLAGYQQYPWAANFEGVGIWTQSGKGLDCAFNMKLSNSYMPNVLQRENVLVATYSVPSSMNVVASGMTGNFVRLFWPPSHLVEDQLMFVHGSSAPSTPISGAKFPPYCWWLAKRRDSFIGILCTHETEVESKNYRDTCLYDPDDKTEYAERSQLKYMNRTCHASQHAWLCVVEHMSEGISEISEFIAFLSSLEIESTSHRSMFFFSKMEKVTVRSSTKQLSLDVKYV
jgi:hypothetical protein